MALLTYQDVLNIRFKQPESVEHGYDNDEVDWFLDQVAETVEQRVAAVLSSLKNVLTFAEVEVDHVWEESIALAKKLA